MVSELGQTLSDLDLLLYTKNKTASDYNNNCQGYIRCHWIYNNTLKIP